MTLAYRKQELLTDTCLAPNNLASVLSMVSWESFQNVPKQISRGWFFLGITEKTSNFQTWVTGRVVGL